MPRLLRVRFGDFELHLISGELCRGDAATLLQEQPLQVLRMLIEHDGELVTREEIKKKLWPNDTIVEFDQSINAVIRNLRKALGDSADQPKYVETLARRGYRLKLPVEWLADSSVEVSGAAGAAAVRLQPEPSLIGQRVAHYRVLEVLGGGGMGMLYKAEDLKLGRQVALKFLPPELASDPLALQRFEREARAASSLDHPNICTIYEVEEYEGQPFIVMQLLQGETLRDRLAGLAPEQKMLALNELLEIAIQVCNGLQAAHEKSIIHRDIKPANIFLTTSGQAKILDFGLAKLVEAPSLGPASEEQESKAHDFGRADGGGQSSYVLSPQPSREHAENDQSGPANDTPERVPLRDPATPDTTLTRTGLAMGTAGYMSPEQVRGGKLDARTDIFSFGLVLYEMSTGQRAFIGDTAAIVQDAIVNSEPTRPRELNSNLPVKLVATIDKALEKDRDHRYQSAAEMRADLELVKGGGPRHFLPQRWKWYAVAMLLIAAAVVGWLYRRSHPVIKLTSKDTLVVADLINSTSDPILDDALNWPLLRAFEQSPYIILLYPSKIHETLKLLNVPQDAKLTPDLAQKVCMRTGSRAFITASIADAGNHYQIDLRASDCRSGRTLAKAEAQADDRNHIVRTLGVAVHQLRAELGEPADSLSRFNTPLDEHFSASLEALQAFYQGVQTRHEKGDPFAVPFFRRAVELDPQFALAYANLGDTTKAFDLRERLSLRARFLIEGDYFRAVTGELEKSVQTYVKWIEIYPADIYPYQNFADTLMVLGQHERAAVEHREAARLVPSERNYAHLAQSFINLNRLNEAAAVLDEAKAHGIDGFNLRQIRYLLAFMERDTAGMQQQLAWLMAKPETKEWALEQPGSDAIYHGRFRAARGFYATMRSYRPNLSIDAGFDTAVGDVETGNLLRARQAAERALAAAPSSALRRQAALVLARAGATDQAEKLAESIDQESPLNTLIQNYELPTIRAAIELDRNRPAKAIEVLKAALPYDLAGVSFGMGEGTLYPAYLRGLAYLKLGQGTEAAAEFQKILDHPGIPQDFIILPLAHLQLARARAMMGDKAAAHQSYQDFLTIWKDADSDIPIYQQAKAEYAKLNEKSE
jgi:serine/threonine protein kinase/tetratricopeptide (TPR) repeat protein